MLIQSILPSQSNSALQFSGCFIYQRWEIYYNQNQNYCMIDTNTLLPQNTQDQNKVDDRVFFGLLEKVGTMGFYQKLTTTFWCVVGYLCGGLMLITPFLFYQDDYVCSPNETSQSCFDYVCGLPVDLRAKHIPEPSIYSLANQFGDFRCSSEKLQLDIVITMMYIGTVVGFLALTVLGDLLNRKLLMVSCLIINVIGLIIVIFSVNIVMAAIGLFFSTVGMSNAFNICFYFLSETVAESHRQKFSVAIQLFYGLGVLSNVFWYYLIGDWQLIMCIFYFVPSILVTISVVIFARDTPICLVTRNSPSKALKDFLYIAKLNKIQDPKIKVQEIDRIKQVFHSSKDLSKTQKKNRFTVIDLFKFKSLRFMTLMLILLQCTIIFQFYAPALMLDEFKLNIFINGLVIGVSEIIAYPICYYIIMKTKRRIVAYACFITTFVCSFVLIFLWDQGSKTTPDIGSSIGVLIFIFIFRFAISVEYTFFYVYFNELYPTQVRVLGTGLVSLCGGIMVTVAPEIIDSCIEGGFPIMILFAVLSIFCVFFSYRLPETFQKTPPDVIEQLCDHTQSETSSILDSSDFNDIFLKDKEKSTNYSSSEPGTLD